MVDSQALGQAHLIFKSSTSFTKQGPCGVGEILTKFILFVPRVRDAIRLYGVTGTQEVRTITAPQKT